MNILTSTNAELHMATFASLTFTDQKMAYEAKSSASASLATPSFAISKPVLAELFTYTLTTHLPPPPLATAYHTGAK